MTERNLLKMFEGILSSQSFELLSEFNRESEWNALKQEEKEVLAQLFLIHGETFVSTAKDKAKEAFVSACRLTPNSAKAHFRLGSFLASSVQETEVHEAICSLERSIALDNRFFDAHYVLACALLRVGSRLPQEETFLRAVEAFQKAFSLLEVTEALSNEFYWHWGLSFFLLGRISKEPYDMTKALQLYQEAYHRGFAKPEFLCDYANAYVELSLFLEKTEYMQEAALLYEESALEGKEDRNLSSIRWFNAACCYVCLFEKTIDYQYFTKAESLFHRVVAQGPFEAVWQKLGQLYFLSARAFHSASHVQKAVECFQKACAMGLHHPVMLAFYSESLLMLYEIEENPSMLWEAMSVAKRAVLQDKKEHANSSEPFLAEALCLYEQGLYFDDRVYLNEALEVLQKTLQDHPRGAALWYALGLVKTRLAEYERPEDNLREANVAMMFASRSLMSHYPYFWNDFGISLLTLADLTEDEKLAEEACCAFDIALQLSHEPNVDWMYNLGCGLDLLGFLRDEDELLEQSLELFRWIEQEDPTIHSALVQQATVLMHLADNQDKEDLFVQADAVLRRYLMEEREDDIAWCQLGVIALRLYEYAYSRKEDQASGWYLQEAKTAFHRARSLGNEHVLYHIASYHALLGNHQEAMKHLWQAEEKQVLPPVLDILDDDRLVPLFGTSDFSQFMREMLEQEEI